MFVVILFLLGLAFGFAARMPWALLAFVIPALLALAAADRSGTAILFGFAVVAAGIVAGLALGIRGDRADREQPA